MEEDKAPVELKEGVTVVIPANAKHWHERNGGNLSYRIKPEEVESVREATCPGAWREIGTSVPKLAGEYFLVTGSGKFFRNVTIKPEDSFCIIELDDGGERYRICWSLAKDFGVILPERFLFKEKSDLEA